MTMADLDDNRRRLTVKLVYYGPALSGKTTNLIRLHDLLAAGLTGDMMTLETEGDRTLFFDLLPVGFTAPSGLLVKFKVFTVPGQVVHDGTRKAVLSRADGVVFVADSQKNQSINNGAAFDNLVTNVAALGMDLATLPLVVQFNKRDMPDIVGEDQVRARWEKARWPLCFASALQGDGVLETFTALLGEVYEGLDRKFSLAEQHGLSRTAFMTAVKGQP
jgi:signal recognition particle receptor subunit beta